jgi:hypothetical protein
MPSSISRELKQRRFRGEPWATNVTHWLNGGEQQHIGKNSRASRKRILDLIDCIRETLATIEAEPHWDLINHPSKKLVKLMNELGDRIAEYQLMPDFYINYGKEWVFDEAVCGRAPAGESVAAHGVIELTKQKLLDRIRCCICGKWFFARFMHQRSCSAKCRHKNYEQSEEFKENRRTYMRNYYRLKTSGKVK